MGVEFLKEGIEVGGFIWKVGDEEYKVSMDIRCCRYRCCLLGIGLVWLVWEFFFM